MTETDIVNLTEIVGDLEVPCDLGIAECDRPAKWVMTKACCAAISLGCDPCKDARVDNRLAIQCGNCGRIWFDASDAYMNIEAINKKPARG